MKIVIHGDVIIGSALDSTFRAALPGLRRLGQTSLGKALRSGVEVLKQSRWSDGSGTPETPLDTPHGRHLMEAARVLLHAYEDGVWEDSRVERAASALRGIFDENNYPHERCEAKKLPGERGEG